MSRRARPRWAISTIWRRSRSLRSSGERNRASRRSASVAGSWTRIRVGLLNRADDYLVGGWDTATGFMYQADDGPAGRLVVAEFGDVESWHSAVLPARTSVGYGDFRLTSRTALHKA